LKNHEGHLIVGKDNEIVGRITWDQTTNDGSMILAVDGRRITKDEFWELLSSYEGWQFKLKIIV